MTAMRHLHGRGVGVAVHSDHFDPQSLELYNYFFAQLTRAAKQDFIGARFQRRADTNGLRHAYDSCGYALLQSDFLFALRNTL